MRRRKCIPDSNAIAVLGRRRARDPLLRHCGRESDASRSGIVSTRPQNSPGSRARRRLRGFPPAHTLMTGGAFAIFAGATLLATRVAAQCAMCGQATGYAGTSPRQAYMTFLQAALVLLVPAMLMLGGVAMLLWRHRHADGANAVVEDATR